MHSHSKSLIVLNFAAICYSQKQACCIKISIFSVWKTVIYYMWRSSSMRGCGLKFLIFFRVFIIANVILRVRMWIEMIQVRDSLFNGQVILRARMWIEISLPFIQYLLSSVILCARMWIEILPASYSLSSGGAILRVRVRALCWFFSHQKHTKRHPFEWIQ